MNENPVASDATVGLVTVFQQRKGRFHSIHPSDWVALKSMLRQLWKQDKKICLWCRIDEDGRVFVLKDYPDVLYGCVAFFSEPLHEDFDWQPGRNLLGEKIASFRISDIDTSTDHQQSLEFPSLQYVVINTKFKLSMLSCLADKYLPSGWTLEIYGHGALDFEWSLSLLRTIDSRLSETITRLLLTQPSSYFEPLMVEILPKFPNLTYLGLSFDDRSFDDIPTFSDVVDRIIHRNRTESNSTIPSNWLWIGGLPSRSQDIAIQGALVRFLEHFNTVKALHLDCSYGRLTVGKYPIDVQYALIQNIVGRRLLDGNKHGHDDSVEGVSGVGNYGPKSKICTTDKEASIPASVWPIVLKRAERECNREILGLHNIWSASARYYLLREGPILSHLVERHRVEEPRNDSPKGKRLKTE